jgi:hypothetical protein
VLLQEVCAEASASAEKFAGACSASTQNPFCTLHRSYSMIPYAAPEFYSIILHAAPEFYSIILHAAPEFYSIILHAAPKFYSIILHSAPELFSCSRCFIAPDSQRCTTITVPQQEDVQVTMTLRIRK